MSPDDVAGILGDGWVRSTYGKTGTGWAFRDGGDGLVYFNEGGSHGVAYWGMRRGGGPETRVMVKLVPPGYKQGIKEKSTIIEILD